MKGFRLTVGAIGAMITVAHAAQGQASPQDAVVAAAEYVRTNSDLQKSGEGELVLDRRIADVTGRPTTDRARGESDAILRALGTRRMGTKEQQIVCTGPTPRDCRLRPQVRVIALSAPRLDGEKASVDVHLWWGSGSEEEPVATKHLIVDLERVDGAWRVKGDRPLRIS